MTADRLRGVLRAAAVLIAAATVASCAGIPASGPVTRVADDKDLGQSAVRYAPARPLPGATPEQIVRGYLDAMLAFPTSSRTAAAFLTPRAARSWRASTGVRVYARPEVGGATDAEGRPDTSADPSEPVKVRLGFSETARLDGQGRYTRSAAPATVTYTLQSVEGQWRITDPQDGLLVNDKFFADYFRPFDLFYFDAPGRRLVPDPVHLVVGDQLATTLVTNLAGGPDPREDDAHRTYVPPLSALRPSVPVDDDGVADVELTADLGDLTSSARDHLSAQLVWTLRQVPGVEGVQAVGGTMALTADGDEVQPVQAWGGYGPSTARGRAYAVVGNRVVGLEGAELTPVSGAWGRTARGAVSVAVSPSGIAGVLAGRDRVRLTARDGGEPVTVAGKGFIAPDWDSDGGLWLVDRPAGVTRVRVATDGDARTVVAPGVAALDVRTFRVSPDGTRYAISAGGDELYVGTVLRDTEDVVQGLGDPRRVVTSASRPRAASWSSATKLSFLGDSEVGMQIYQVAIDGSATTSEVSRSGSLLPDVGVRALAIGQVADQPIYVTDADDRLWFLAPGGSWRMLSSPPVTGLAVGR